MFTPSVSQPPRRKPNIRHNPHPNPLPPPPPSSPPPSNNNNKPSSPKTPNPNPPPSPKRPKPLPTTTTPAADRLSDLHDALLFHILSFLPTKQAARTSLLSRRYRALPIPNLDFDLSDITDPGLVDRVLASRCPDSLVRRLSLVSRGTPRHPDIGPRISHWVLHATARGVQNLRLDVSCPASGFLELTPDAMAAVFGCRSLESLQLSALRLATFALPGAACFSKLRVLHLNHVVSGPGDDSLGRLVAICPVLEDLLLAGDLGALVVKAPKLRRLKLTSFTTSEIRVYCPRLQLLNLWSPELQGFGGDMPALVKGYLSVSVKSSRDEAIVGQILASLERASFLSIQVLCSGSCTRLLGEQDKLLPTFQNLRSLDLKACLHFDNIEAIICMLEHSPNLHILCIRNEITCNCYMGEFWKSRKLPSKFLDCLKEVYISNSSRYGLHNQDEFLKFLSMNVRSWHVVIKHI